MDPYPFEQINPGDQVVIRYDEQNRTEVMTVEGIAYENGQWYVHYQPVLPDSVNRDRAAVVIGVMIPVTQPSRRPCPVGQWVRVDDETIIHPEPFTWVAARRVGGTQWERRQFSTLQFSLASGAAEEHEYMVLP
jgi:hypothetical protein